MKRRLETVAGGRRENSIADWRASRIRWYERRMLNRKVWALGLGIAVVSVTGLALADINIDRLQQADDNLTKALALCNAAAPANSPESKQITKAKNALVTAQAALQCAIARAANSNAACP